MFGEGDDARAGFFVGTRDALAGLLPLPIDDKDDKDDTEADEEGAVERCKMPFCLWTVDEATTFFTTATVTTLGGSGLYLTPFAYSKSDFSLSGLGFLTESMAVDDDDDDEDGV